MGTPYTIADSKAMNTCTSSAKKKEKEKKMSKRLKQLIATLLCNGIDDINDFLRYKTVNTNVKALSKEIETIDAQMSDDQLNSFYERYDIRPNERQRKCRAASCFNGENFNETYCRFNDDESPVTNDTCNACENFKSKYIEYPITVNKINLDKKYEAYDSHKRGMLVAIRPYNKAYNDKTYAGVYLGDMVYAPHITYNENTKEISVGGMRNPAIYVFELKKIIYGMESFWQPITSIDDIKDISDDDINNQFYVQMLKAMYPALNKNEEATKKLDQNHQKLNALSKLIDDILTTEPDDEALNNDQKMIDVYAEIHNLKEALQAIQ